jgi:hypothetical protein
MQVPDFAAACAKGTLRLVPCLASSLLRLTRRPDSEPYYGKRKASRFDDPLQQYGVTYAAFSLEVAFAETVLHEHALYQESAWVVHGTMISERSVVRFDATRELLFADLTGPSLKALGLDNQISAGTDYAATWALSRALHDAVPECDGILYVSRHHNKGEAVALFERSGATVHLPSTVRLDQHQDLEHLLQLFGVEMLPDGEDPSPAPPPDRRSLKRIR